MPYGEAVYSEWVIANLLARKTFPRALVVVDDCSFTGSECDLLIVHQSLKLIDVEIKTTKTDLARDQAKDKWLSSPYQRVNGQYRYVGTRNRQAFPDKIWRHYYVIAEPAWTPECLALCGDVSGVFVLKIQSGGRPMLSVKRKAKDNPDAKPVTISELATISRLASLRMWDAYKKAYPLELDKRIIVD